MVRVHLPNFQMIIMMITTLEMSTLTDQVNFQILFLVAPLVQVVQVPGNLSILIKVTGASELDGRVGNCLSIFLLKRDICQLIFSVIMNDFRSCPPTLK